jgi:hypothetical protein
MTGFLNIPDHDHYGGISRGDDSAEEGNEPVGHDGIKRTRTGA